MNMTMRGARRPLGFRRTSVKRRISGIGMALVLAGAAAGLACASGSHIAVRDSGESAQRPRDALAGDWTVEFRLDSTRAGATWRAASGATVLGTLHLADSSTGQSGRRSSSIHVDFGPVLGRPMSCMDPVPTQTGVGISQDTVTLNFTPSVADCGFGAAGELRGDSIVGTWSEESFAGPVALGRFRASRP